jgi:uncharacterized glyoxalase superfamily protein PhnB
MSRPETFPRAPKRAQPESLRARSLSASLTCNDLAKSLAWYRDVLGFTVEQTWDKEGTPVAHSLKAGDVRLVIFQDDGAKGWDRAKGEGFRLYLTTVQDVDEVAKRIKEKGGRLDSEPADMPWGTRAFTLSDPDGFKLTISFAR